MARAGIYKSEVLRARDNLVAQGRYPSIDAVRTELGNTGSKGTIHRYLKEIEEEEGGQTGNQVAVSEALQDLIARLAARLHEEADARFTEATAQHQAQLRQQADVVAALKQEADGLRTQLERTELSLAEAQMLHAASATTLQTEQLARTQLTQQVIDLQAQLSSEAQHRQSLEEKHQHAREALDHFRQSVKEQREQLQRQHDQQVQYLQGEVRTLNQTLSTKQHEYTHGQQDNARLSHELAQLQTDLHRARHDLRSMQTTKEHLAASQRQLEETQYRLQDQQTVASKVVVSNEELSQQIEKLKARIQQLEIDLAGAHATAATKEQLIDTIRAQFSEMTTQKSKAGAVAGRL
jgi:chromosome segregation ATPase